MTQDGELSLEYDQNGNRTDISYPGGAMATYTFDYADREATLSVDDGGGVQSIVTSASYLPSGPLDGLVLGNGLEEIRPFDSRYYPDEIRVSDGVADLLHWDYTVDGTVHDIATVLTTLRKRRCSVSLILQELSQLRASYGTDAARTIFSGDAANKLFFGTGSGDAAVRRAPAGAEHRLRHNVWWD